MSYSLPGEGWSRLAADEQAERLKAAGQRAPRGPKKKGRLRRWWARIRGN